MRTQGTALPDGAEPPRPGDPRAVGGYRVLARLGEGGMGSVLLGTGPDGRLVAIKLIRRELALDPGFRARFDSEVAAARSVAPFCTARVLDHGRADGSPYLITEYIAGPSLEEYVKARGALPPEALRALAVGIATALAAIHTARLVHRDLKPSNVLLSATGPRVIDFGIARAVDSTTRHTQTGHIIGSPGWLAPEQVFEGAFGTSADVFAWGSLVAYAATGRHPYGTGNLMVLAVRAQRAEHDLSGVPDDLLPLVSSALAPDPRDRPSTERLLVTLVGEEDPLTEAQQALTRGWSPSVLPNELFAPPPPVMPTPPPFPVPPIMPTAPLMPAAPVMPAAPPMLPPPPMPTAPRLYIPPHPPRRSNTGSRVAFTFLMLMLLAFASCGVYVVLKAGHTLRTPGSSRTANENLITSLPDFCKRLLPALPADVKRIKEKHRSGNGSVLRNCNWDRRSTSGARHLAVTAEVGGTLKQARKSYASNWEYAADPKYHSRRERVRNLGEEAYISRQYSPIVAGPNERAAISYWMGGVTLGFRHRNIVVGVTWTGADYPKTRGRVLKGRNIPYHQAEREALKVAKAVLKELR
ncbi:serine/threonine-protein kinase [Actinomadura macrotermitis]|uniref:Serine/threonine-protein kinase PknD n=1 Tax=Actinomadura macrotermitis TaxID=2585200 RepID=A0A7K0BUV8_9ACTN|nr:serine/threonine-protein kinase [Actinomadura macrotermitis]MQY04454.1 Serine/threonine-protein kinase PknD [Actinomadura macrotermitis]